MKGEKIKEILRSEGFVLSDVAKLLGFDNDQRLHSALRSDDVKTGLVEDIARVTNRNVCLFYGLPVADVTSASDHSVAISGDYGHVEQTEQTSFGDRSPNVKGNGNHVNSSDEVVGRFLDELSAQRVLVSRTLDEVSAQRVLVEQALAQNSTLISILQSMTKN